MYSCRASSFYLDISESLAKLSLIVPQKPLGSRAEGAISGEGFKMLGEHGVNVPGGCCIKAPASPDFKPVMNQRVRCAEVPWVKESGTT
jgi:hypothetical protein